MMQILWVMWQHQVLELQLLAPTMNSSTSHKIMMLRSGLISLWTQDKAKSPWSVRLINMLYCDAKRVCMRWREIVEICAAFMQGIGGLTMDPVWNTDIILNCQILGGTLWLYLQLIGSKLYNLALSYSCQCKICQIYVNQVSIGVDLPYKKGWGISLLS